VGGDFSVPAGGDYCTPTDIRDVLISSLRFEVRRLQEVDGLTGRQIAEKQQMGRRTVSRIIGGMTVQKNKKPSIIAPYQR
jgi:hypothetical protein